MTTKGNLKSHLTKNRHAKHQTGACWHKNGDVFLDVSRLEELICVDLPRLTNRPQLGSRFVGLAERYESTHNDDFSESRNTTSSSSGFTNPELDQAVQFLMEVINRPRYTALLPPQILSEIHSFCGVIHDMHREFASSEQSHLRALWVARNLKDYNKGQVQASVKQLNDRPHEVTRHSGEAGKI
ncbi:hypothetical protein MPSEU_000052100 [Mayamaea pseudoterrestris]|nr:hypothetical protein MPSEU_000052100 [Mayamaea pseudoterrestris]